MSTSQPATAASNRPAITIANRFEIGDPEKALLNQGSMGDVYRGTDTHTGQTVAIKALKSDIVASNPDLVTRFAREAQVLRQLEHPNIVKMIATVKEKEQHYLVMEYVGGGSLRDLLEKRGTLSIARALEIGITLANALTHTHRRGIIHRDLKPTNVLLARDGAVRLTDFGVAYVAGGARLTKTGIRIGTINYFSPEACNGEKLDARTDVWALGAMLYEMLAGERPFTGKTIVDTLVNIVTQPIPDLPQRCPGASPTLSSLIYNMLEKDRAKRIPNMPLVEAGLKLEARLHERGDTSGGPLHP